MKVRIWQDRKRGLKNGRGEDWRGKKEGKRGQVRV